MSFIALKSPINEISLHETHFALRDFRFSKKVFWELGSSLMWPFFVGLELHPSPLEDDGTTLGKHEAEKHRHVSEDVKPIVLTVTRYMA
jgi:hypothetical protein